MLDVFLSLALKGIVLANVCALLIYVVFRRGRGGGRNGGDGKGPEPVRPRPNPGRENIQPHMYVGPVDERVKKSDHDTVLVG